MAHSAIYSTMDYIIQENAWSSSGSTSQRRKQPTSKVFLGDESKSFYIVTVPGTGRHYISVNVLLVPDEVQTLA